MTLAIRPIRRDDLDAVFAMMRELAREEGLEGYFEITIERLAEAIFSENCPAECLVAELEDGIAAYALYFPYFSSFRAQTSLYIDDLFVRQASRGKGIGKALLAELARLARSRGFVRLDLLVSQHNKRANGFYKSLGAATNPDERHFKFVDSAFDALAERSNPEYPTPHQKGC